MKSPVLPVSLLQPLFSLSARYYFTLFLLFLCLSLVFTQNGCICSSVSTLVAFSHFTSSSSTATPPPPPPTPPSCLTAPHDIATGDYCSGPEGGARAQKDEWDKHTKCFFLHISNENITGDPVGGGDLWRVLHFRLACSLFREMPGHPSHGTPFLCLWALRLRELVDL